MNLYHYCSNEAFHSIISNSEIRLSSLTLSNDYMEGKLVEEIFIKIAREEGLKGAQMKRFRRAVDQISVVDQKNVIADGLGFCLSEEKDLLSQWRGYANDAQGVSIGFSKEYLKQLSGVLKDKKQHDVYNLKEDEKKQVFNLKQVIYEQKAQELLLRPTYQKIKKLLDEEDFHAPRRGLPSGKSTDATSAFLTLLPAIDNLYALKTTAFKEELEWRLISFLTTFPDQPPGPCLFNPSLNKIKPYRTFRLVDLKITPIKKVVLGPKNTTPKRVIESFLKQNNFNNVEVIRSKASYI